MLNIYRKFKFKFDQIKSNEKSILIVFICWNYDQIQKFRGKFHKTIFKAGIKLISQILKSLRHGVESLLEHWSIFWDIHRHDILCFWFRKLNRLSRINCIDLGFNVNRHPDGILRIISVSLSDNISTDRFLLCNSQSFWCNCGRGGIEGAWIWSGHCWCDHNCFHHAIVAVMDFRFLGMDCFISNWGTKSHRVDSTRLQIKKTVKCFWKLVVVVESHSISLIQTWGSLDLTEWDRIIIWLHF